MNKIIKISICFSVVFVAFSCDKFLTENPKTSLFENIIFENELHATTAITGCYSRYSDWACYGQHWVTFTPSSSLFATTGIAINQTGGGNVQRLRSSRWDMDGNMDAIANQWNSGYVLINACAKAINGINKSAGISDEAKNRLSAEARFLRAVMYFNIVRYWGNVPFYLTPATSIEEAHRPKSPVNVIFDAIIDDFEFAFEHMMTKNDSRRIEGRPFNYAAKAMLVKVYVHLATSEYFFLDASDPYTASDREGFWRKAYQHAKDVYDAKVYSLLPDYDKLWRAQTRNSDEGIFEIQFNPVATDCQWHYNMGPDRTIWTPLSNVNSGGGSVRPTKVMFEWHREKYTRFDQTTDPPTIVSRDPRLSANYVVEGRYQNNQLHATAPGGWRNCYPTTTTGDILSADRFPCPIKFLDPYHVAGNNNSTNWIYYRYADLLLLLAESANEIDDPDGIKFNVVNELMTRARNSYERETARTSETIEPADWDSADPRYADKDLFREEVMKERLFELPLEGHEWFDVRRRGMEWFIRMATQYNDVLEDYAIPAEREPVTPAYRELYIIKAPTDYTTVRKYMLLPLPFPELINNRALTVYDQNWGYSTEINEED